MGKCTYDDRDNWKPKLSDFQRAHQPAIEWYLEYSDDVRRSGRTYLAAVTFIRQALLRQERRIMYYDHFPMPIPWGGEHLGGMILELTKTDDYLKRFNWEFNSNHTFVCLGLKSEYIKEAYDAWLAKKEGIADLRKEPAKQTALLTEIRDSVRDIRDLLKVW